MIYLLFKPDSGSSSQRCKTHRQSALSNVGRYEPIDGSIFSISRRQSLHLVVVNSSEHEDGHGREEDEDDDGRHDGDDQRCHAVAGQLIGWKGRKEKDWNAVWSVWIRPDFWLPGEQGSSAYSKQEARAPEEKYRWMQYGCAHNEPTQEHELMHIHAELTSWRLH